MTPQDWDAETKRLAGRFPMRPASLEAARTLNKAKLEDLKTMPLPEWREKYSKPQKP
jgi:hypothetical protein